ncbi:hypothetical protein QBC40DRAFT_260856 [Triangularia verruculosa]|uniref:VWFA domain-containing protein n=1 Tax=Triangularia verruculosa TaxID=2587418 RepID=A0AAN6XV94_9PEZI|nr:hypothetical protein QBC40DRAFT_260856 [Triangularia verruculosa]
MRFLWPHLLLISTSLVTASISGLHDHHSSLKKRQDQQSVQACTDLTISSNNGDRKVAIVIDSSGSMSGADPDDLRLAAAKALNDFLVSNSEAGGEKRPDQVAVVGFDFTPYDVFGPGDPGDPAAPAGIDNITLGGGTYIAGGVYQAMGHLAAMGGETKGRSAIVVFTDGSDSDTDELVSAIRNATSQDIRVSFGYLDSTASAQPQEVLRALRDSKGVYATITIAAGSQNFINYVLLNGLTTQDNAQGAGDRLLAGLATTQFVSGSSPVSLKYTAEQGENANFTVISFTGDRLTVEAKAGGQTFQSETKIATSRQFINLTVPSNGEVELLVTATNSPVDGLFSMLTNSNRPIKNCTVGVIGAGSGGLSAGAKAGVGIGVIAAVVGLGAAGFYAYKHFFATGPGAPAAAPIISGPILSGAEGNIAGQGGEKVQVYSNVSPVQGQIGGGAPTDGISPMAPTGYEANNLGPGSSGTPPSNIPPTGPPAPAPPQPATLPPTGNSTGAFIPPMVPPLMKPPAPSQHHDQSKSSRPGSQHSNSFQPPSPSPVTPGDSYPPPPLLPDQYQQPLPHDHHAYQHPLNPADPYHHYQNPIPGNSFDTPYNSHQNEPPGTNTPDNHHNPHKPTFPVPGPPSGWKQKHPQEEKHHHHPWLAPDMACEHPDCPLNLASHKCEPNKPSCGCRCLDGDSCAYLMRVKKS